MKLFSNRNLVVAYLVTLAGASTLLGFVYSIFNTDPHHWGFITGTALDFIGGRRLFSEIYVQYGAGQPILFWLMSHVIPINYTTVGFVTSLAYAGTLVTAFLCIQRVASTSMAFCLSAIAFLIHPYAIYPWPDYFAGLFVCLSCYALLRNGPKILPLPILASGAFLFLAFLFRNTYLLNITCASILYLLLMRLRSGTVGSDASRQVTKVIVVFFVLLSIYLTLLLAQGDFVNWYRQNLGAASTQYGVGKFKVLRWFHKMLYPNDLVSAIFFGLFLLNAYLIWSLLMNVRKSKDEACVEASPGAIFCALLGLAGTIQCLNLYEVFRLQNASISMYIGTAVAISFGSKTAMQKPRQLPQLGFGLTVLAVVLFANLPFILSGGNTSIYWPIIPKPTNVAGSPAQVTAPPWSPSQFGSVDSNVFRWHLFDAGTQQYYSHLTELMCDGKSNIINLTLDSTIPYLCANQKNAMRLPFYSDPMLANIESKDAERIRNGIFLTGEIIVSDSATALQSSSPLEMIGTVLRPASLKWMESAEIRVYRTISKSPGGL